LKAAQPELAEAEEIGTLLSHLSLAGQPLLEATAQRCGILTVYSNHPFSADFLNLNA
jgi:hypothetical protein